MPDPSTFIPATRRGGCCRTMVEMEWRPAIRPMLSAINPAVTAGSDRTTPRIPAEASTMVKACTANGPRRADQPHHHKLRPPESHGTTVLPHSAGWHDLIMEKVASWAEET